MLPFPVSIVAFEGVNLELLKGSESFQIEELVLDSFSKTTIKLTIKCNIIPSSIGSVLREFNQIFIDVVVLLHFEGLEGTFQCLSEVRLSKQLVKLRDKFGPVALDGWFRVSHKVRLPPK